MRIGLGDFIASCGTRVDGGRGYLRLEKDYRTSLKKGELRWTPSRKSILQGAYLLGIDRPFSLVDLQAHLRCRGLVHSQATLYRTLSQLLAFHLFKISYRQDGVPYYQQTDLGQQTFHLLCADCGETIQVKSEGMKRPWARASSEAGFSLLEIPDGAIVACQEYRELGCCRRSGQG
ncbi:transcriptional repressor [bacterium]|nr:transcriptional repressor [bacterium]